MTTWTFEPGHTAAEFCARHMMVSYVRGHFKNIQGTLHFDPENSDGLSVEMTLDARGIWTGEPDRDEHLRSADFLDVENHPVIRFNGKQSEVIGAHDYKVEGDLTIRGLTRKTAFDVRYLGKWETPWWEDGEDRGPKTRAGFVAKARINRHDFGVSWSSGMEKGGIVVSNLVDITVDAEAIVQDSR